MAPRREPENDERASTKIIRAASAHSNRKPVDLPPLADTLDTDSLDCLIRSADAVNVEFPYAGFLIAVTADGDVSVDSLND